MRFLIDRCAELGPDPGDRALLEWAAKETRILVTIDTDFGELIYLENVSHAAVEVVVQDDI
jgi:predicted nuclease of predicted toxin-antitoxin system